MDLCVEMGEPNPYRMMERIGDARLFTLWRAYWRANPFGYWRHNMHAILTASAMCKSMPPAEDMIIRDRTPEFDAMFEAYRERKAAQENQQHGDNPDSSI